MKITDFNVAIVENDTHLSKWIVEQRRLDVAHDQIMNGFAQHIPRGGCVIDVGASLGDHTATYSNLVGPDGLVIAYEPNPVAYECLAHNMRAYPNVAVLCVALGAQSRFVSIEHATNHNLGMARVVARGGDGEIMMSTLDSDMLGRPKVDFIKIDVEGYEPLVLAGARETLLRDHPVLLVEIQKEQLAKNGFGWMDVVRPLIAAGYDIQVQDGMTFEDQQIDVLCTYP